MIKKMRLIAGALAAAMALTACGGKEAETNGTTAGSTAQAESTEGQTDEAVSEGSGELDVLKVGLAALPTSLDPDYGIGIASIKLFYNMFDTLLFTDKEGNIVGRLAESWECSIHPDGPSVIASGRYAGQTLPAFLEKFPQALGEHGKLFRELPILVKLIDAERDLSIQVHPDDAFSRKHEGQLGKTEMWYVLHAEPGATLVYGFAHTVTPELVRHAIETNTLLPHLQTVRHRLQPAHRHFQFLQLRSYL